MDRGAETRVEMLTLGALAVILALFLVGKGKREAMQCARVFVVLNYMEGTDLC